MLLALAEFDSLYHYVVANAVGFSQVCFINKENVCGWVGQK